MSAKPTDIEIARQMATAIALARKRPVFDRQLFISALFRRVASTIEAMNDDRLPSHVNLSVSAHGKRLDFQGDIYQTDSFFIVASLGLDSNGEIVRTTHRNDYAQALNIHVDPLPLSGVFGRARALANRARFEIFGMEWLLEREWRRAIASVLEADCRLRIQYGMGTSPKLQALVDAAELSLSCPPSAAPKLNAKRI